MHLPLFKRQQPLKEASTAQSKRVDPDQRTAGREAAHLYRALAAATRGRTVVLITQRLSELSALVDEVAIMREGHIVGRVDTASYLRAPSETSELVESTARQVHQKLLKPGQAETAVANLTQVNI